MTVRKKLIRLVAEKQIDPVSADKNQLGLYQLLGYDIKQEDDFSKTLSIMLDAWPEIKTNLDIIKDAYQKLPEMLRPESLTEERRVELLDGEMNEEKEVIGALEGLGKLVDERTKDYKQELEETIRIYQDLIKQGIYTTWPPYVKEHFEKLTDKIIDPEVFFLSFDRSSKPHDQGYKDLVNDIHTVLDANYGIQLRNPAQDNRNFFAEAIERYLREYHGISGHCIYEYSGAPVSSTSDIRRLEEVIYLIQVLSIRELRQSTNATCYKEYINFLEQQGIDVRSEKDVLKERLENACKVLTYYNAEVPVQVQNPVFWHEHINNQYMPVATIKQDIDGEKFIELLDKIKENIVKSRSWLIASIPRPSQDKSTVPDTVRMDKDFILSCIRQGRMEKAFKALQVGLDKGGQDELSNKVDLLSNRFFTNQNDRSAGVVSVADFNVERTKVANSLLKLVKENYTTPQ